MAWTDPHAKERKVAVETPPRFRDADKPGTHQLTDYSPKGSGPRNERNSVSTSTASFP